MTCARCHREIPVQPKEGQLLPEAEHTEDDRGRLLHWTCYEIERASPQTEMFT